MKKEGLFVSTGTFLQDKHLGKETESTDKLRAAAEAILTLAGIIPSTATNPGTYRSGTKGFSSAL